MYKGLSPFELTFLVARLKNSRFCFHHFRSFLMRLSSFPTLILFLSPFRIIVSRNPPPNWPFSCRVTNLPDFFSSTHLLFDWFPTLQYSPFILEVFCPSEKKLPWVFVPVSLSCLPRHDFDPFRPPPGCATVFFVEGFFLDGLFGGVTDQCFFTPPAFSSTPRPKPPFRFRVSVSVQPTSRFFGRASPSVQARRPPHAYQSLGPAFSQPRPPWFESLVC